MGLKGLRVLRVLIVSILQLLKSMAFLYNPGPAGAGVFTKGISSAFWCNLNL